MAAASMRLQAHRLACARGGAADVPARIASVTLVPPPRDRERDWEREKEKESVSS